MKTLRMSITGFATLLSIQVSHAQLCTNPADTVYGLNSITGSGSGQIVAININNAGAKTIGSAASLSANANGLGFSQITGLFYFFNRIGNNDYTEFVSYNPMSGSKVVKAKPAGPALPLSTSGKIRTGTVTRDGSGYYMLFPGATTAMGYPVTNPAFYYYSIALDQWRLLTQSFKDAVGNTVAEIKSLNSGDMAFDGQDNLWILASNSNNYALYRINAPLPTTAVASVVVDTVIPSTPNPISGVSFTGIAFNSAGKMVLSTGSCAAPPCAAQYNRLYEMSTAGGGLTLKGTLPVNGYGDDLTSCIYPVGVLASTWLNLAVTAGNEFVTIGWKANETDEVSGYDVEFSANARDWQVIGHVDKILPGARANTYSFTQGQPGHGKFYYRVSQLSRSGERILSETKAIEFRSGKTISIGPNPVRDVIHVNTGVNEGTYLAQVFDQNGCLRLSAVLSPQERMLDVRLLSKGVYILRLTKPTQNLAEPALRFIKW